MGPTPSQRAQTYTSRLPVFRALRPLLCSPESTASCPSYTALSTHTDIVLDDRSSLCDTSCLSILFFFSLCLSIASTTLHIAIEAQCFEPLRMYSPRSRDQPLSDILGSFPVFLPSCFDVLAKLGLSTDPRPEASLKHLLTYLGEADMHAKHKIYWFIYI